MLFVLYDIVICFIVGKIQSRLVCYSIYGGVKLLKYHSEWHKRNDDNLFNKCLDWVLL